jgi:hypothetical protein
LTRYGFVDERFIANSLFQRGEVLTGRLVAWKLGQLKHPTSLSGLEPVLGF